MNLNFNRKNNNQIWIPSSLKFKCLDNEIRSKNKPQVLYKVERFAKIVNLDKRNKKEIIEKRNEIYNNLEEEKNLFFDVRKNLEKYQLEFVEEKEFLKL